MNVLLISTGRLRASYFEKARRELGDGDVVIDVLAWLPPREPVGNEPGQFLLLGPGQLPEPTPTQSEISKHEFESSSRLLALPEPLVDRKQKGPASPSRWNRGRIKVGLLWRYKRARRGLLWRYRRAQRSKAARRARQIVLGGPSRRLWRRARGDRQAQRMARTADLFVVVDGGAVRTGWHLARRHPNTSAVLGLPAAAEQVKALRGCLSAENDHRSVSRLLL